MKNNDWKSRLNIVYSTNPEYQYEATNSGEEQQTLP
ncbi:MAG: translation initiation factor, partial [Prevotellaceae bacterium]|nr:translation initiation factor [Prevotellaceae bacterium]